MSDVVQFSADGFDRNGQAWIPDKPFYAVLGDPIAHSLSPVMHSAALAERELEFEYLPIRVSLEDLAFLKEAPGAEFLTGFNVTAPLKEAVAKMCDGRTDQARDIGVVNTVKVEDGKWLGHNTDSGGVLTVLSQLWPAESAPEKAVVLGAGGSARAAIDALIRWDVPDIDVRNRSAAGRQAISDWLKSRDLLDRVTISELPDEIEPAPQTSSVWISCLAGGVNQRQWLPEVAGNEPAVLLDLRYGNQLPDEDAPLGFLFSEGLPVLLMQGGLSFVWWFGPPVPWQIMRDTVIVR